MSYTNENITAELDNLYLHGALDLDLERLDEEFSSFPSSPVEVFISAFAKLENRAMTLTEVMDALSDIPMNSHNNHIYLEAFYKVWADFDAITARKDNLLNDLEKDCSDWKVGFNKALIEFLLTNGTAVVLSPDNFTWEDFFIDKSLMETPVAVFDLVESDDWVEFDDTISGTNTHYGITADVLYQSGLSRRVRVECDFGEIVRNITSK